MSLELQVIWLLLLALPVASISWTVTHEEIFREPRDFCIRRSQSAHTIWLRKFFYLFTCEYCFSHYVAAFFIILTGYKLLCGDWRGYLIAFFAMPWIANLYLGIFGRLKLGVKKERAEITTLQHEATLKELQTAERRSEERPVLHQPVA